ncbi:hypothetical protein CRG98_023244 [Punica granatum]|uniref:Uncharacterized protein n=1 Tax=Punica granatum TaxID=22663 RepID=A0A2I0JJB2_PUNGR|nr:hypothetical protein CRG98_023244 [Punica granatum]
MMDPDPKAIAFLVSAKHGILRDIQPCTHEESIPLSMLMGILLPIILNFDIFVVWIDAIGIVVAGHLRHSNSNHCIVIELDETMYRCLHDIVEAWVDDMEFGNKNDLDELGNFDVREEGAGGIGPRLPRDTLQFERVAPDTNPVQWANAAGPHLPQCGSRSGGGPFATWRQMGRDLTPAANTLKTN